MKGTGQLQSVAMPPSGGQKVLSLETMTPQINSAVAAVKKLQLKYRDKSFLQLLVRIRRECGKIAAIVTIARIERNQGDKLSPEDRMFLEGQKHEIFENPSAEERFLIQNFHLQP